MERARLPVLLLMVPLLGAEGGLGPAWLDWWITPEQQGQWLLARGEPAAAARRFRDPLRRGVALFRAGDFEAAAAAFGRGSSPEAAYDRGNSLVMMGKYEDAIRSYDQALVLRPAWREAEENRQVARIRLERLAPPESDHGGTGGMLSADEFVFDERGAKGTSPQTVEGGEPSEAEMRAVWLRRVQTQPADFLRSRFAYQLARQGEEDSP